MEGGREGGRERERGRGRRRGRGRGGEWEMERERGRVGEGEGDTHSPVLEMKSRDSGLVDQVLEWVWLAHP